MSFVIANFNFLDINECAKSSDPCSGTDNKSNAKCVNTEGSYKCVKECESGFEVDSNGDCVDVNECVLGNFDCKNGTEVKSY